MKNFLQTTIDILGDVNLSTSSKALRISEQAVFYNKEFHPDCITEYFQGWKIKYGLYYRNSKLYLCSNHTIMFNSVTPNCMSIQEDNEDFEDFIMPRTIDEFITDCQQVGIDLERKA